MPNLHNVYLNHIPNKQNIIFDVFFPCLLSHEQLSDYYKKYENIRVVTYTTANCQLSYNTDTIDISGAGIHMD